MVSVTLSDIDGFVMKRIISFGLTLTDIINLRRTCHALREIVTKPKITSAYWLNHIDWNAQESIHRVIARDIFVANHLYCVIPREKFETLPISELQFCAAQVPCWTYQLFAAFLDRIIIAHMSDEALELILYIDEQFLRANGFTPSTLINSLQTINRAMMKYKGRSGKPGANRILSAIMCEFGIEERDQMRFFAQPENGKLNGIDFNELVVDHLDTISRAYGYGPIRIAKLSRIIFTLTYFRTGCREYRPKFSAILHQTVDRDGRAKVHATFGLHDLFEPLRAKYGEELIARYDALRAQDINMMFIISRRNIVGFWFWVLPRKLRIIVLVQIVRDLLCSQRNVSTLPRWLGEMAFVSRKSWCEIADDLREHSKNVYSLARTHLEYMAEHGIFWEGMYSTGTEMTTMIALRIIQLREHYLDEFGQVIRDWITVIYDHGNDDERQFAPNDAAVQSAIKALCDHAIDIERENGCVCELYDRCVDYCAHYHLRHPRYLLSMGSEPLICHPLSSRITRSVS